MRNENAYQNNITVKIKSLCRYPGVKLTFKSWSRRFITTVENQQTNQTLLWIDLNKMVSQTIQNNNTILCVGPRLDSVKNRQKRREYFMFELKSWLPGANWVAIKAHYTDFPIKKQTKTQPWYIKEWVEEEILEDYHRT